MSEQSFQNSNEASIPYMITRDMHQQLADLGYNKEARSHLTPEEATAILSEQTFYTKRQDQNKESKEVPTLVDYEIIRAQWEDAYERLMDTAADDEKTLEIIALTTDERASAPIFAYIARHEAELTPEQKQFLLLSAYTKEVVEKIKANRK